MSQNGDRDELRVKIARWLDDDLDQLERSRFEDRLKSDPEARDTLRDMAEQAVVIADEARAEQYRREKNQAVSPTPAKNRQQRSGGLVALVAAVVVLLAAWWALDSPRPSRVVSVTELNGPVRWIGDEGKVRPVQSTRDSLRGGTVRTLSDAATVTLRFSDGSEITLAGDSEVTFSEENGQKHVYLNRGDLSASIERQPTGRPFIIHTTTAKLEVLGTRFEVRSEPDATVLSVSEGAVRVTRRVDGTRVDVPANHQVRASLSRNEKLQAIKRKEPLRSWSSDLSERTQSLGGKTLPPSEERAVRVGAEPILLPKNQNREGPVTIHRVQFRVPPDHGSRLELTPESVLRFRGYLEQSQSVEIMLGLNRRHGGFAGNFFYRTERLPAGAWEIEVSATRFGKWDHRADSFLPRFPQLRQIVLYTIDADAGLEVESVVVQPR